MQNRSPSLTARYAEKANDFLQGMKLLAAFDIPMHRASIGLLAVHSAISLNDAIQASIRGERSKAQDHSSAARELQKICSELNIEELHGVRHFASLLSKKSDIAYGDQGTSDSEVKAAIDKVERFTNWAYTHFKEVLGVRRA